MKIENTKPKGNNLFETAQQNWKQLKKLVIIQLIIIALFLIIKPNYLQLLALSTIITVSLQTYPHAKNKTKPKYKKILKNTLKNLIIISILYYLFTTFAVYGFAGFLLVVLLYTAFILFRNRKQYVETIKTIFSMIWGKRPEEFEKGELKNTKIKIKWGKNGKKNK